ncbi:MAG: translocation/assembly module TamB domain-containing protein [Magnetospirillum sp.]|nr:translocation/assembly module TamB domain-containing protein [Magnetospirillum sp.]
MPPSLRRLAVACAAILVALIVAVGGAAALLHAPAGERLLGRLAMQAAPSLTIDGLHLRWPFRIDIRALTVADDAGVWLTVQGIEVAWHPAQLLRRRLVIDRLVAAGIDVARLPQGESAGGGAFRLPLPVGIDAVSAPIVLEPPVAGRRIGLVLDGTVQGLRADGRVDLSLRADDGAQARIAGSAGSDYLDLRWYLTVPRLESWQSLAGQPLAGRLTASGFVAGRLPAPVIDGVVEIGPGRLGPLTWRQLNAQARVVPEETLWLAAFGGTVDTPHLDGHPALAGVVGLEAAGDVALDLGRLRLGRARLTAAGAELAAVGVVEDWGRRATLMVHAEAPRLDRLGIPTGLALKGRLHLDAHLAGNLLTPDLTFIGRVQARAFASGIAALDRLLGPAPKARLAGHLGNDGRLHLAQSELTGAKAAARLRGRVSPTLDLWTTFVLPDLSALGEMTGSAQAQGRVSGMLANPDAWGTATGSGIVAAGLPPAAGTAAFDLGALGEHPAGAVGTVMEIAGYPVEGAARVELGDIVRITGLMARSGDTQVAGTLTLADGLRGRLRAEVPDLSQWVPASGRLSAVAALEPGTVALRIEGADLAWQGMTAATLAAAGRIGDRQAAIESLRLAVEGQPIRLTAPAMVRWSDDAVTLAPVRLAIGTGRGGALLTVRAEGSVPLAAAGALDARASVSGDLGRLTEAVPALVGHVFTGRLDGEVAVSGTLAAPRFAGRAHLAEGSWEFLDMGTTLTGLTADAVLDGERVRLNAAGRDGQRGQARLAGEVSLAGAWNGRVTLAAFNAVRRDDVRAVVDAGIGLDGNPDGGTVSGSVTVTRGELDIARLGGGDATPLEVVEINPARPPPPSALPAESTESTAAEAIRLDLALVVERAFARGRGLDSVWDGRMLVGGTVAAPELTGAVQVDRGRFDTLGRSFKLSKDSRVSFDGSLTPRLDVTAEAQARDAIARVALTGTPDAPALEFTSEPPLPKDEILARLLFDKEAGKLSAMQQIQLARMAAGGLAGGEDGFDPVGKVRGMLGLDVLDIGASSGTSPTLSAGKYIGEDTFVRVDQGTGGLGSVAVERELGAGFTVSTQLGQMSGGGLGLNWRRNY